MTETYKHNDRTYVRATREERKEIKAQYERMAEEARQRRAAGPSVPPFVYTFGANVPAQIENRTTAPIRDDTREPEIFLAVEACDAEPSELELVELDNDMEWEEYGR